MAKTKTVRVADGPEYRFLGSLFGALIASAGIFAGTMVRERSFDYWLEDIVPLLLFAFFVRGLFTSSIQLAQTTIVYNEKMEMLRKVMEQGEQVADSELELPLLPQKPKYSDEEVLAAVSKRIQDKRTEAGVGGKMDG